MANAFDEMLASFQWEEDADREAVLTLAEKYPDLKGGWLRQSDYSRKQDELKAQREEMQAALEYAEQSRKWHQENWVPDAYGENNGATKRELEKDAELQRLQQQLEAGEEVNFEQVQQLVNDQIEKRGYLSQESFEKALAEKEAGVNDLLGRTVDRLVQLPSLAVDHYKTFDEKLDTDALLTFATEHKEYDLKKAYAQMVEPQMKEREANARKDEIEEAKKQAREEALNEIGVSEDKLPTDSGSPAMGHLQARLTGNPDGDKGSGQTVSDEVPFGRGHIAAQAARNFRASEANVA